MRQIISQPIMLCVAIILILFAFIMPVSATFQIQQSTLNPSNTPLQPGAQQSVTAVIAIIPQGTTTFIVGNQLQLTTDLDLPQWDVQVMVNGRPAAVIPAKGNTVFINGFLLSYPDNNDVSVSASVTGIIPTGVSSVNLLQVSQLNNAGQTIPGAVQTISEPVEVPVTMVPTNSTTPSSPVSTSATPAPTKASGLNPVILIGGMLVLALAIRIIKKD
jgi:hypothetical protein